jgi:hypothetical protein
MVEEGTFFMPRHDRMKIVLCLHPDKGPPTKEMREKAMQIFNSFTKRRPPGPPCCPSVWAGVFFFDASLQPNSKPAGEASQAFLSNERKGPAGAGPSHGYSAGVPICRWAPTNRISSDCVVIPPDEGEGASH